MLSGDLTPGEHVRQEDWAARLGVSRAPVREALKTLVAEHLVSHDPHRGYFVTRMGASEMVQVYRIRLFLEPEVLRSIRPPTPEELQKFASTVDACFEALAAKHVATALEAERSFFFALYDLSTARIMAREAKRLWDLAEPYRTAALVTSSMSDPGVPQLRATRDAMLDALGRMDREALVRLVVEERTRVVDLLSGPAL